MPTKKRGTAAEKPTLEPGMSVDDFTAYYWLKEELTELARQLDLPTHGYKPELSERIERRLRGLPARPEKKTRKTKPGRDSDKPLTRDTPVVHFKSDAKTRAFFKSEIGPEFHFTYHVNQYRLNNEGLTYGDLIDEWLAERDRRNRDDYKAPLASHGKYNIFVRDFFADPANEGKSMQHAAAAWNAVKHRPDGQHYAAWKAMHEP